MEGDEEKKKQPQQKGTTKERAFVSNEAVIVEGWRGRPGAVLRAVEEKYGRKVDQVDQVVVDVSNALRNKTNKAVLRALCRLPRMVDCLWNNEPLSEADWDEFVDIVAEELWPRMDNIVVLLKELKSNCLLLAFDGGKEDFPLLKKGRVEDPTADFKLKQHDADKVRTVLGIRKNERKGFTVMDRSGKASGKKESGSSDVVKKVHSLIADALHRSVGGREVLRLIMCRVVPKFSAKLGDAFKIDMCTSYEADSLVQNSEFTVLGGKLVDRPPKWGVAVIAKDWDVLTEIRTRSAADVFVYLPTVTRKTLLLHSPVVAQLILLGVKVERLKLELGVDELVISKNTPLTETQKFVVFLLWGVRGTDYEPSESGTKGLIDKAGSTVRMEVLWLAERAFYGVLVADKKLGREDGFTLDRFAKFLLNDKVKVDKLDQMSVPARVQLAGALTLPRNLRLMIYSMLSRALVNFPLLVDGRRGHVVNAITSMFPKAFLGRPEVAGWVTFATSHEFVPQPFTAADLRLQKVDSFLAIVLPPRRQLDQIAKSSTPSVPLVGGLKFRHATMTGTLGGKSVAGEEIKRTKKKKKEAVDCSIPWPLPADADYISFDDLSALIGEEGQLPNLLGVPPPREGAKRVLVVGMGEVPLQRKSVLLSTRPFSDYARLLVSQLEEHGIELDIVDDGMLRCDVVHASGCAACAAGFPEAELDAFIDRHRDRLLQMFAPDVVIVFGSEAAHLYAGCRGPRVVSVLWPELAPEMSPSLRDAELARFWDVLYGGLREAHVALGLEVPDVMEFYELSKMLHNAIKISRMEHALLLKEKAGLGGTKGTAGLAGSSGPKGPKKQKAVAVKDLGTAGKVSVDATRTGVPFSAVQQAEYVKAAVEIAMKRGRFLGSRDDASAMLAELIRSRMDQAVNIWNALRIVMMLLDQIRAVVAAAGAAVTRFDRESYENVFWLLLGHDNAFGDQAAINAFDALVHIGGVHAERVFRMLRQFVREEIWARVTAAKLDSCFATFFLGPLAKDRVTRLDIVARQQTLLVLDSLFHCLTRGQFRSAVCAVFFAFSAPREVAEMLKWVNGDLVAESDVDVWETVSDKEEKDGDWVGERQKCDHKNLMHKVQSVLQRLSPLLRGDVFAAGQKLREIVLPLVAHVRPADDPFKTWESVLTLGTFGASSGLVGRGTANLIEHDGGATLGTVREGLSRALFGYLDLWMGCRLAPVPGKPMAFHLPRERFHDTPGFRQFLLGAAEGISWYEPNATHATLGTVFGVEKANSIIYTGGNTFSYFMLQKEKRTATALLKRQGPVNGVRISSLWGTHTKREERRQDAMGAVQARVDAGKAPPSVLTGNAVRVPVGEAVGLVHERRLRDLDLPFEGSYDAELNVLIALAAVETRLRGDFNRGINELRDVAGRAARAAAKERGESLEHRALAEKFAKKAAVPDSEVGLREAALAREIAEEKARVRATMQAEAEREKVARAAGEAAKAAARPSLFTIKLQSGSAPTQYVADAVLEWLKAHPLVPLDPGMRWVVSGIVAVLIKYELKPCESEGGGMLVTLEFAFRVVRVSGHKWNRYRFKPAEEVPAEEVPGDAQRVVAEQVESLLNDFTTPEFLKAEAAARAATIKEVLGAADAEARLRASLGGVMRKEQILRDEARNKHQRNISLAFVRRLDEICKKSGAGGDPIVIVGAAGGGGGRGRAQVKHEVLLKTLAGFFTVVMLDEHCTSKKTTCCHRDAHAPRSKGRSRGCKNKECCKQGLGDSKPKPPWWDRDTGAAW